MAQKNTTPAADGTRRREWNQQRLRRASQAAAEIGPLPKVKNPKRRKACSRSLLKFLVEYFPRTTGRKPFSADHERAIERMERCVRTGGQFVNIFPRGFGKTTLSENSALWAVLYGLRRHVLVLAADQGKACEIVESIKSELENNPLLAEDFPEVCYPIRQLEGRVQRAPSQTVDGERTDIGWRSDFVSLPVVAGSVASGAIVSAKGIMGASRGTKHKTASGEQQRPDLILPDDPQTDESAATPSQVAKRLGLINRLPHMGGHEAGTAVLVSATIIQPHDAIDQLSSSAEYASWQSERIPMVRKWPDTIDTNWRTYTEMRRSYAAGVIGDQARAHAEATEYYRANREAMDRGAEVTWEHCHRADELSALQHAMNLRIDHGEEAFASECQNAPLTRHDSSGLLTAEEICRKTSGFARSIVPAADQRIVGFVDVQKSVLFYCVAAWGEDFTGSIIEYGTFPRQTRAYFTKASLHPTLESTFPRADADGCIYQGLQALTTDLCSRVWKTPEGAELRLELCLIDEGYRTQLVHNFIRASKHAAQLKPSKGYADLARFRIPFLQTTRQPGDRYGRGFPWRERNVPNNRALRFIGYDTNWFKTFAHERLAVSAGSAGSLTLHDDKPAHHQVFADHLLSEYRVRMTNENTGRTIEEWTPKPERDDNDFFDCLVGVCVAGAVLGVTRTVISNPVPKREPAERKQRVSYLDHPQGLAAVQAPRRGRVRYL